jgi:hypothetical protein
MKRAYRSRLTSWDEHALAVPYALVTGEDPDGVPKRSMVAALVSAMPWTTLVDQHNAYISGLDLETGRTLSHYRGAGSMSMNQYLRSGTIRVPDLDWHTSHTVIGNLVIARRDAARIKSSAAGGAPDADAVRKIADGIVDGVVQRLRQAVIDNVTESAAVFRHVHLMNKAIEGCPGLAADAVLWRGEQLDVAFFYRPKTARQKTDARYAFKMRDLKKGDTFERPDFTSFSADVFTSYGFTHAGCCLMRLKAPAGAKILVLDGASAPVEYECIASAGARFRVTGVTDVKSTVSKYATFRVIDVELSSGRKRSTKK